MDKDKIILHLWTIIEDIEKSLAIDDNSNFR